MRIGVVAEEMAVNDFRRPATADGERIADDRPLRLAKQAQNLPEIVNEACDDEPARLIRRPDGFCRLQRVFYLREVDVGIAVVDERVEKLERSPDRHRLSTQSQIFLFLREHERERLPRVVQRIELLDARPRVAVVPELAGRFRNVWTIQVVVSP